VLIIDGINHVFTTFFLEAFDKIRPTQSIHQIMAIFSLSDVVISLTLILNACTLLAARVSEPVLSEAAVSSLPEADSSDSLKTSDNGLSTERPRESPEPIFCDPEQALLIAAQPSAEKLSPSGNGSFLSALKSFLSTYLLPLRRFSCAVVIWNVIFVVLVVFIFGD
jgi:hypothetical protein